MTDDIVQLVRTVWVYKYNSYFRINSTAAYRATGIDESGFDKLLPTSIHDDELGESVLQALGACRLLQVEDANEYFSREVGGPRYERWLERFMGEVGAKDRRKFFKALSFCILELAPSAAALEFQPQKLMRGEGWSPANIQSLASGCPVSSAPELIGRELRNVFTKMASTSF